MANKPPVPPSDNPFFPRSLELATLDGETDLDSLPELSTDDVAYEGSAPRNFPTAPTAHAAHASALPTLHDEPEVQLDPELDEVAMPSGHAHVAPALTNLDGSIDHAPAADTMDSVGSFEDLANAPSMFGPALDISSPVPVAVAQPKRAPVHSPNANADQFAAPDVHDQPLKLDLTLAQMTAEKPPPANDQMQDAIEMAAPDPHAYIADPSRLFGGALRRNPQVHLIIGFVIAIGIGFMLSRPVQRRAEKRIEYLHQQAREEAKRGYAEATEKAQALEARAESDSTSAFVYVLALWLAVAGGVFAIYYRFT